MGVKVHYFGGSPNLLGAFHSPQRLRARSASVLLCNPFGEEASRAHRIYRVLATQLERAGYATLRFDFSGTGDSSGDASEATIDQWLSDLSTAAGELRRTSGSPRVALVGLRFGATLAALASSRGELRPRHLVLWDPVVSGAGYLRELAAQHRQYMTEEMGDAGWTDRLELDAEGFPTEALGVPLPAALRRQIAAIDLVSETARTPLAADLVTVISTGSAGASNASSELERWRVALEQSASTRWIAQAGSAAWNSDAALNAATVPMDIVQTILSRIEETIP